MRKLTLGATILLGGMLFALPFRRPPQPLPAEDSDALGQSQRNRFDDDSIRMLVQEVTEDVKVPVIYDPQTDYVPPPAESTVQRYRPLTYEDLAVPEASDPMIENRFNATVGVAQRSSEISRQDRIAELERLFASKSFENQTVSQLQNQSSVAAAIESDGKQWVYSREAVISPALPPANASDIQRQEFSGTAHFASTDRGGRQTLGLREDRKSNRQATPTQRERQAPQTQRSILSQLPPPGDSDVIDGENNRQHHWIRQPE